LSPWGGSSLEKPQSPRIVVAPASPAARRRRVSYGLTSTKQKSASARGAQIVPDRTLTRQTRKPDFTSPRVANPP